MDTVSSAASRCTSATAARSSASRRRRSAGANSGGIWNAAKSAKARRIRCKSASSCATLGDRVGWAACSPRRCSIGARSNCFRSAGSAARQAPSIINASRALRPCFLILWSSASWSSCGSDVSACARVGPIAPDARSSSTDGARRVPIAFRRATQSGLWPSRRATWVGVRWSSSINEHTTRASSSAVIVRAGALTASISRLCCTTCAGASTTTGTVVAPCSRQRSSRLNPSRTSKAGPCPVSGHRATRSGRSAPCSMRGDMAPGRSGP